MSCNDAACDSLLESFEQMEASSFSSHMIIPVNAPTTEHLRVVNNGSEIQTVDNLTLKYEKVGEAIWHIKKSERLLQITFDFSYLIELKNAITKIKRNEGDFGISYIDESDDNILTFWWHPRI